MSDSSDAATRVSLINRHGTVEEQLPRPGDGQVKALSTQFRDFVSSHSTYTLIEVDFSLYGQIETTYFTDEDAVEEFNHPQAEPAPETSDGNVIVHYTTDIA